MSKHRQPLSLSDLASNDDRQRLLALREACRGERVRIYCLRCRKQIPESRRSIARYCSTTCHNSHRWEEQNVLRSECRQAVRVPRPCPDCGAVMLPPSRGPLPKRCKRCKGRLAQRRYRQR